MSEEPEVEEVEPCPYLSQLADGESEHMPISAATMARMLHVHDERTKQ